VRSRLPGHQCFALVLGGGNGLTALFLAGNCVGLLEVFADHVGHLGAQLGIVHRLVITRLARGTLGQIG
jgi:hypothetical protein